MPNERNIKVFISYRNAEPSKTESECLAKLLKEEGFEIFWDVDSLQGAMSWPDTIVRNVRESDILIVLLQGKTTDVNGKEIDGTEASDWVQREVDVARGANIGILPIRLEEGLDITSALKRLALEGIQYETYLSPDGVKNKYKDAEEQKRKLVESEDGYRKIVAIIENLVVETKKSQKSWFDAVYYRRRVRKAEDTLQRHSYSIPFMRDGSESSIRLHIASGDLTNLKAIDVLVNSENNFMQMARIFERYTLSSSIRREGSHRVNGRLQEDTVQEELDEQIEYEPAGYFGRPVMMGQVIVTSAGHKDSNLVKNGVRFIFHTATMRVDTITNREKLDHPIDSDEGISRATRNCLLAISRVDEKQGNIFTAQSKYKREISADPIKSIGFPLFCTGHGGLPLYQVAGPMVSEMIRFVQTEKPSHLEDIYLCVYSEPDIDVVRRELEYVLRERKIPFD